MWIYRNSAMYPCGQYFAVMIQMNTYPLTLQRTNWNLAARTRIGLRCPFCNPMETVNNMLTGAFCVNDCRAT